MSYPDGGRDQLQGQPPHWRTWHRQRATAFLRAHKMSSKTDVDGYQKAIEPEFKTIARDLLETLDQFPDLNNLSERIRIDKNNRVVISAQPIRDGNNSIHNVLKQIIFPPEVDYQMQDLDKRSQSRDLRNFVGLFEIIEGLSITGRSKWWKGLLRYSSYLWTEDNKIKFMQKTEEFTVRKHPRLADIYNKSFEDQFGWDWKSTIPENTIMNQVLEYQPKVKPYEGPADAVRLWSNGFKHYEQYLPFKERGITDAEKAWRISLEFPDVVQKTWRSVMTLLTGEGYLNKAHRKELIQMLGWAETDFKVGGIGLLIATSLEKLEADDASRTRRSVHSVSNSASGSVSASRGTSEVAAEGRSWKAALMATRRGG